MSDDYKNSEAKTLKTPSHFERAREEAILIVKDTQAGANKKIHSAANYINEEMSDLKDSGAKALGQLEKRIQANPGQSVAIAFTAGMIASMLIGKRKA